MGKIQVLQLGEKNWEEIYTVPDLLELFYMDSIGEPLEKLYDLVFLDRTPTDEEAAYLHKATRAYTLFVTRRFEMTAGAARLYQSKKGKQIAEEEIQDFLLHESRNFFSSPYGEKFEMKSIAIAQGFRGIVKWNGNYSVCLKGNFGEDYYQAIFWRGNIPIYQGQCIDLWLEYRKSRDISISLAVTHIAMGSLSNVLQKWRFHEEELKKGIQIDNRLDNGKLFFSLLVKGKGELRVIALHNRHSRRGHGLFLPGGEQFVTSGREEVFCYFDPGDMKPPLNVYFSGYKTMEGFEGYYLMRNMGSPFLLIAEARLEGGAFYMGFQEYEDLITHLITKYREELGFTADQVILTGLSMGSFGALYYGCDIRPHAMIVGKPVASIGDVAANGKLRRPGAFATSFDVLGYLCDDVEEESVKKLNDRFWDKFDRTDWSRTKIIVAYMIEDDYDGTAYSRMLEHVHSEGVQLYGKGIHGRHNDNSAGIVNWFSSQLKQILREDFQRKADE